MSTLTFTTSILMSISKSILILKLILRIALKRLLRQTLAADADLIDVHPLADYILEQNTGWGVGSTIKTEGTEADPYAVLGVLDLDQKVSCGRGIQCRSVLPALTSWDQL
jgi:hypothetical protein